MPLRCAENRVDDNSITYFLANSAWDQAMDLKEATCGRVRWTFLSNHGNVLLAIARNPDVTLREVAVLVGITERAVQRIVTDLEADRYLERVRTGRRNRYKLHPELPLRHPICAHREIGARSSWCPIVAPATSSPRPSQRSRPTNLVLRPRLRNPAESDPIQASATTGGALAMILILRQAACGPGLRPPRFRPWLKGHGLHWTDTHFR